ncbi:hypothetical protein [Gryllotalpicola protaetiae]|uniref:Uncharacterized protein n=1 Tax=Gryllotalpicola protaetiae TaxID=2419771 RepID=A0A387BMX4_9MICO|nr:hypothetical protein [Gryllotalpicola protaetiae]AYG04038.1 hypothetical protein D7I44_11205 [Gryllotalpicola protaetiae]
MLSTDAGVRALVTAHALRLLGQEAAPTAVDGAVRALSGGADGSALRELAGLPASDDAELDKVLHGALDEVGVDWEGMSRDDAVIITLHRFTEQGTPARLLADLAHALVGHAGPEIAQRLVALSDELDDARDDGAPEPDSEAVVDEFLHETAGVLDEWLASHRIAV